MGAELWPYSDTVMAHLYCGSRGMACISMAYTVMAYIGMGYIVMTHLYCGSRAMAFMVIAYIIMADIAMIHLYCTISY